MPNRTPASGIPRGAARANAPKLVKPRPRAGMVPPLDPQRYAPTPERPVRAKSRRLGTDVQVEPHTHPWGQVAFSATGVSRVSAVHSTFIVPPSRAVWIPAGVEHTVTVMQEADMRTLYLYQAEGRAGPEVPPEEDEAWRRCRVIEVSPLLRELVLQLSLIDEGPESARHAAATQERERCIAALVCDELRRARPVALGVAMPQDKRLRTLCKAVVEAPARHATLEGWARNAGASPRTVARLFQQELGTSFVLWRQQVLLAKALSMAAQRQPMSHIAAELGYASASAFTAMVTRSVGMPPSKFFAPAPT